MTPVRHPSASFKTAAQGLSRKAKSGLRNQLREKDSFGRVRPKTSARTSNRNRPFSRGELKHSPSTVSGGADDSSGPFAGRSSNTGDEHGN